MGKTVSISLKGEDPAWGGLVDLSELAPTSGMFTKMLNCVIGKDGSEIESWPGTVLAASPRFMDKVPLGGTARFTVLPNNLGVVLMTVGRGTNGRAGHGMQYDLLKGNSFNVYVRLEILLKTGQFRTISRMYACSANSPNSITIPVIHADDPAPTTWASIQNASSWVGCPTAASGAVNQMHGLKWVNGHVAIVAVAERVPVTGDLTPAEAVATWRVGGLDWTIGEVEADLPWEYWPSAINTNLLSKGVGWSRVTAHKNEFGKPHEEHYPPRRKCNLHVANDDLIIAVPGQGVVLQVNLSRVGTPLHESAQYTRLLGVPKGGIFSFEKVSSTGLSKRFKFDPGTIVWVAVGYRDRITGQVGLPSDPMMMESDALNEYGLIRACAPRLMLNEAWGMEIIFYTSGEAGNRSGPFWPFKSAMIDGRRGSDTVNQSEGNSPGGFDLYIGKGFTDRAFSWDQKPIFPTLEQFPMGSSWAITIRGTTFYGGGLSHAQLIVSKRGLDIEQLGFEPFDERVGVLYPVQDNFNQIRFYHLGDERAGDWKGQLAAGYRVPSSYQGTEMYLPVEGRSSSNDQGSEYRKVRLLFQHNDPNADENGRGFPWSLDDMHWLDKANVGKSKPADLLLNRGHVQHSELGFPGITPSINRIIFDRIQGIDTRAAGRLKDSIVVCTEKETYRVSWGRSPLGSDPVLISDTYGCIAPNSMVEFPGGLAWLSKDGPVISDGAGVHWVGVSIHETWKSMKRDSEGMMGQAFGAYDVENMRIIWGVRQDLHVHSTDVSTGTVLTPSQRILQTAAQAGAGHVPLSDDDFATVPNDTLLVYNHQSRAFSTHHVEKGRMIVDMERMPDENGTWRMFVLEEDGKVYQFDNRFMQHRSETRSWTVAIDVVTVGTTMDIFVTPDAGITDIDVVDKKCMIYRGTEVIWTGIPFVSTAVGSNFLLFGVTAADVVIKEGDIFVADITEFELETTFKGFGQFDMQTSVNSLILLHTTERLYPDLSASHQFAKVSVVNPAGDEYVVGEFWGQSISDTHRVVFEQGWGEFALSRLKIKVFGDSFTKLKDVILLLEKAG